VRPFVVDLAVEYEFRVVIAQGVITAISQIFTRCRLPEVVAEPDWFREDILRFTARVLEALSGPQEAPPRQGEASPGGEGRPGPASGAGLTVVVDLCYRRRGGAGATSRVARALGPMVVELNTFGPSTSFGLFHFEQDREVLLQGPLEFRYNNASA
jgi:hypothetical protein